jgi:hypothetical protein
MKSKQKAVPMLDGQERVPRSGQKELSGETTRFAGEKGRLAPELPEVHLDAKQKQMLPPRLPLTSYTL